MNDNISADEEFMEALNPANVMSDDDVLCYMHHDGIYFLDRPLAIFWAWKRGFPLFTKNWDTVEFAITYAQSKFGRTFEVTVDTAPLNERLTRLHYIAARQALMLD